MKAIPYFFGPPGHRLFGWYYAPQSAQPPRAASILLCQPIGHEYMYAYRAFRVLAERLAARGFPVLRFDYRGTGDASGEPHGPNHVTLWRESVGIALAELRRRTNGAPVAIVGLRLGAMVGALAAAEDGNVDAVALWDPCVAGKAYVRQVKMLAATSAEMSGQPVINEETGHLEALGYALTPEMISDMQAIDLSRMPTRDFPRTLLIRRENNAQQLALGEHLNLLGTIVTSQTYDEADTFLVAAERSVLPTRALTVLEEWLDATYPLARSTGNRDAVSPRRASAHAPAPLQSQPERFPEGQSETPVMIDQRLFAMMTTPLTIDTTKPAVIFLNMGTDHHVGPRRLHVHLARHLATLGATSFRVDLMGMGDSMLGPDTEMPTPYPSSALDDIGRIIRYVRESHGIDRVVLAGMCAGGYHAVHSARMHEGVVGFIAVNPPLYMKIGDPLTVNPFDDIDSATHLQDAIKSPRDWARLLRQGIDAGRVRRGMSLVAGMLKKRLAGGNGADSAAGAGGEPTSMLDRSMESFFSPQVDTHLIFDAGDLGYRYIRHIGDTRLDTWLAQGRFTLSVVDGANHVFMPLAGQAVLNRLVIDWLADRYFANVRQ